jgi:hypothetical protein
MSDVKSPFMVYQNFISPKLCDSLLSIVKVKEALVDNDGYPAKAEGFNDEAEKIIFQKFEPLIPEIEAHYNLKYAGCERMLFQYFPEGMAGLAENPHCENSAFVRKKWVKVKNRDLTAILWLKDFNNEPPLDRETEIYGGKLEFPLYNFSLQPQRGSLVIYPAGPHFISATSQVLIGEQYCVRLHMAADGVWLYDGSQYAGTYVDWFKTFA